MDQYLIVGVFLLVAVLFPVIGLSATRLLRPSKPNKKKLDTYECGVEPQGTTRVKFRISYFLYALIFLVFDVETVFLYPWAVTFQMLGTFVFIEMFIFLTLLVIAFWYAWKEGALEWM